MRKYFLLAGLVMLFNGFFTFESIAQNFAFEEDFSRYPVGASPASIKTNGVAIIARPAGQRGKWLVVKERSTYKLNRPAQLPKNFTFEFDVLAQTEQIKDIAPISFGFVKDNAAREHISNGGAFVQLHYYDGDAVNIGNYDLKKEVNVNFDLPATANSPLHVELVVKGEEMTVYLNDNNLSETILFQPKAAKYFYISGPWSFEHNAQLFVSNFKLSTNP